MGTRYRGRGTSPFQAGVTGFFQMFPRREEAAVTLIPTSNDADGPFWLNQKGTRD